MGILTLSKHGTDCGVGTLAYRTWGFFGASLVFFDLPLSIALVILFSNSYTDFCMISRQYAVVMSSLMTEISGVVFYGMWSLLCGYQNLGCSRLIIRSVY